jgi:DNA polymerase-3 subunit gamma/tau
LNAASTLEQMTDVLHRMMVSQTTSQSGGKTSAVDLEDEDTTIASLATQMPADEIQLLYSICLHGKADLGLASDEYAALTMILLRLLAFKPKKATDGSAAEPSKKPEMREERPPLEVLARPEPVRAAALPVRIQRLWLLRPCWRSPRLAIFGLRQRKR